MFELYPMYTNMRMPSIHCFPMREAGCAPIRHEEKSASFGVDVIDAGDAYELKANLPGFKKEDISVNVDDGLLTLKAERNCEENVERPNYVRRELFHGSYSRCFDLDGIDSDGIEASYEDGVLLLKLPKLVQEAPEVKKIEIK